MKLYAGCKTTAMGIMPHTDIDRAIELAFSLDIPFWPQLPNVSFYEDMYAQSSQNFPGISVDTENKRVSFNTARFEEELATYSQKLGDIETFTLSRDYSAVYHRFLAKKLNDYPAIRGQLTGPVSFGFKIVDENAKPIIYNEEVKSLLFDFIQRKVNVQYQELCRRNENAFVWVDEPGLGWVFSGLSGYNDTQALKDYRDFIKGLEGPRALHLCANVNLPFLLELGVSILSFDAYQLAAMPREYAKAVGEFVRNGGIMCWGIVPTDSTNLGRETPHSLSTLLSDYWVAVSHTSGVAVNQVAAQSLLAPARCCLKNIGQVGAANESACVITEREPASTIEELLVEKAFAYLREMSQILRDKYDVK
jgi:hypothetical protein